jgi:hypothetical protein
MKSTVRMNLDGVLANDYELTFSNSIDYRHEKAPLTQAELDAVWVGLCDSLYKRLRAKIAEQELIRAEDPTRIIEQVPYDFGEEIPL